MNMSLDNLDELFEVYNFFKDKFRGIGMFHVFVEEK